MLRSGFQTLLLQQPPRTPSPQVLDRWLLLATAGPRSRQALQPGDRTRPSGKTRHASRQLAPNQAKRPGVLGKALNRCRLLVDGPDPPSLLLLHFICQGLFFFFSSPSSSRTQIPNSHR